MWYFSYVLYMIQLALVFTMHIPNSKLFDMVNKAASIQDYTGTNGSINNPSIQISLEIVEQKTATIINYSTTWRSTTSTGSSTAFSILDFKKHLPILIAIGGGILLCVIITVALCCCCKRRRQRRRDRERHRKWAYSGLSNPEEIELPTISRSLPSKKTTIKSGNKRTCAYLTLAREYAFSLGWKDKLFEASQDRCYCKNCYSANEPDVIAMGGAEYVIPRGWVRIGLHVDEAFEEEHSIWDDWIVTFHGTSLRAAHSILTTRQFCLPGDKLMDGTVLGIRPGHIPNKRHLYTSPTIAYSSLPVYSPTYDFHSSTSNRTYSVRIVLQCRQKPNTFTVQGETVNAGTRRLCQHIPNTKVEYYTDIRASIIAYGLLVLLEEQDGVF